MPLSPESRLVIPLRPLSNDGSPPCPQRKCCGQMDSSAAAGDRQSTAHHPPPLHLSQHLLLGGDLVANPFVIPFFANWISPLVLNDDNKIRNGYRLVY